MQKSLGVMELGTLSDNVSSSVVQTALKEVNKPQHPTVTSSDGMSETWRQLRLK